MNGMRDLVILHALAGFEKLRFKESRSGRSSDENAKQNATISCQAIVIIFKNVGHVENSHCRGYLL